MKKNRFLLLIALCILTVFGFKANAQEAMAKMKKTYPSAMQEYGKKMLELKTDYIIAIDVSATMGKHKEEVVPALSRFFDSIGDGNYVRIISFGTIAKEEQTRLEISKQTRPQIIEKLNYVYDKVMNDPGMKGYTDFVLLGNKVVDLVESDNDSDIHFLVIFSDIMDDPKTKAPGSKHRSEKEWNDLQQRFKSLEVPTNTLSTYFSHEAKDEKQILESIELVKNAFPEFEYSNDINEVLGNMLDGSKFIIYTEKLKQLIISDINEIGKKELFSSQIEKDKSVILDLKLNDDELKVKKYIRGIVVDTCIINEKSDDVLEAEFGCHKEISKRSGSKSIGNMKLDWAGFWPWNRDCFVEYNMQYHFIYLQGNNEKAQSFTKDMEALGLIDQLPQMANLRAEGPLVFIWPFWLIVVIALILLLFLALLIKNTIIPGRIKGKRFFCVDPVGNKLDYWVENERCFVVGNDEDNWNLKHPEITFKLLVKAKNGGPLNLIIKRKVMCYLIASENSPAKMSQTDEGEVKKANILVNSVVVEEGMGQTYTFTITED